MTKDPAPGEPSAASPGSGWSFGVHTYPFLDADGQQPAEFVFEQIGDDRFEVVRGILYRGERTEVAVGAETKLRTDFASIPLFMAWFVPVNGRHTPAAVVHDKLVAETRLQVADRAQRLAAADSRAEADSVFLDAMRATEVPRLRRALMYAAVTMATRWSRSWPARLAIALWVLASVSGSVVLVVSLLSGAWLVAAAAIAAPLVGASLWGPRQWAPGVLAGYSAWVIALPALGTAIGYGVYWVAEQLVRIPGSRPSAPPPPAPYR